MPFLPDSFVHKMSKQLGDQAQAFLDCYQQQRTYGLRINTLKVDAAVEINLLLNELQPLKPVPWCPNGYYYDEEARPGLHPYHDAGVYYIQEPSAMSVVELLNPQPGELILDLAAAPGGKSSHIAEKLQGKGVLVTNEIYPARAKALSQNIERMGIKNAIVTNCSPDQLVERFPFCFDRVLLDAPCSGEGMFRKNPRTAEEWSPELVSFCAARQRDILLAAVTLLKPGGILVYSTCTFSREENEHNMEWLLQQFPEMCMIQTERIWPHLQHGEGHYIAVLQKSKTNQGQLKPSEIPAVQKNKAQTAKQRHIHSLQQQAKHLFDRFAKEAEIQIKLPMGELLLFGEQLYWLPHHPDLPLRSTSLSGLKIIRPGLHLGAIRKKRFEPAHALAMACHATEAPFLNYEAGNLNILSYLRGEERIHSSDRTGWRIVAIGDYPLGWGKVSDGRLKNHYPKGLRRS